MVSGEHIRSYCILVGVTLLITQTAWMASCMLYGITLAILTFIFSTIFQAFQIIFNFSLLLIIFWYFISKKCSNQKIINFISSILGPSFLKDIVSCEVCRESKCDHIFSQCAHSFHIRCIPLGEESIKVNICPKCVDLMGNLRPPKIIQKILDYANYSRNKGLALIIFLSSICALYRYISDYWFKDKEISA